VDAAVQAPTNPEGGRAAAHGAWMVSVLTSRESRPGGAALVITPGNFMHRVGPPPQKPGLRSW
jgi:hypothetical protein